jgi:hypothetical protein
MSDKKKRPDTFAGCLQDVAEWLDACDKYIRTFGPAVGTGLGEKDTIQTDLRRVATAVALDPELDARLMRMMDGGE